MALSTDQILSDIAGLKQQIIFEGKYQFSKKAGLKNYIDMQSVSGRGSDTGRFPYWSAVTASETPEGSKAAVVKSGVSYVDIQATKKTVYFEISREALEGTILNAGLVNAIAPVAADAMANKVEEDVIALFSSFTTNTVGTTNTDLTQSVIRNAVTKLGKKTAAGADPSRFIGVLSPIALENLQSNIATASYLAVPEGLKNELFKDAPGEMAFNLFGVPFLVSSRIVDNGSGDHICALFDKKAIGGALQYDIALDTDFDVQRQMFLFNWRMSYGVGVAKENWGVAITADGDA